MLGVNDLKKNVSYCVGRNLKHVEIDISAVVAMFVKLFLVVGEMYRLSFICSTHPFYIKLVTFRTLYFSRSY